MKISHYAINHPAVITILLVALLPAALLSIGGLKRQLFARVELPQALIFTTWPGGTPEEVEREITDPLEDELSLLSGVTEITSTSSSSLSFIMVSFTMDTRMDEKIPEIRERINNVGDLLPEDISGSPELFQMTSSNLSAFTAACHSKLPLISLTRYMNESALPRLSRIRGVGKVTLTGSEEREAEILLDPDRLTARNLTPLEILKIIEYANYSLPAGSVTMKGKNLNIRTSGRFESLGEIAMTVVGYDEDVPVRLRDVAEVQWAPSPRKILALSGGREILLVSFDLVQEADASETIGMIKDELDRISREQEGRITFSSLNDDSQTIEYSLNSVLQSAAAGGILAVIILFLFLHNIRLTAIISLSIPFSLMMALAAMRLRGMTLNIMTLGGLTVAIGMIVDASIVILENIHRHFDREGDKVHAARKGADEMGGAITASTLTSLAVFLPMLFLGGLIGEILRDISLTMAFALLSSLLSALVVVPFLSFRLLKPLPGQNEISPRLERIFAFMETFIAWLERKYFRLLKKALKHRAMVLTIAFFLLISSVLLTGFLGFEFIPSTDMNEIVLTCEFPSSYDLEKTRDKTFEVEEVIGELVPELRSTTFSVGGGTMITGSSENMSYGNLQLVRQNRRTRRVHEIINQLQYELPRRVTDLNVTVKNGGFDELLDFSTGGVGMVINVYGSELDELVQASDLVMAVMEREANIKKVDRNISVDREELIIELDHLLMGHYGVTPSEAALTCRIIFNGSEAGELDWNGERRTIRLSSRFREEDVDGAVLDRITVKNGLGDSIPLGAFSTLDRRKSVSAVQRRDGVKTIRVTGQLYEANLRLTGDRVLSALDKEDFPSGVEWDVGGSSAEMSSSFRSMFYVMGIAVFLVYMVMVIQFERFLQPLIVMASVPFTLIGVVLGLLLFGSTLNVISLLGVIALSGIVVNNAIVLIDYTNLLRSRGLPLREAVIKGATSRLKPIIMTTLTTLLGLLPIALGWGEGGDMLKSLGQAIAGGLITSTLITLILIPLLYIMLEEKLNARKEAEN